jgi:methyl-accepting chemotaxis protein
MAIGLEGIEEGNEISGVMELVGGLTTAVGTSIMGIFISILIGCYEKIAYPDQPEELDVYRSTLKLNKRLSSELLGEKPGESLLDHLKRISISFENLKDLASAVQGIKKWQRDYRADFDVIQKAFHQNLDHSRQFASAMEQAAQETEKITQACDRVGTLVKGIHKDQKGLKVWHDEIRKTSERARDTFQKAAEAIETVSEQSAAIGSVSTDAEERMKGIENAITKSSKAIEGFSDKVLQQTEALTNQTRDNVSLNGDTLDQLKTLVEKIKNSHERATKDSVNKILAELSEFREVRARLDTDLSEALERRERNLSENMGEYTKYIQRDQDERTRWHNSLIDFIGQIKEMHGQSQELMRELRTTVDNVKSAMGNAFHKGYRDFETQMKSSNRDIGDFVEQTKADQSRHLGEMRDFVMRLQTQTDRQLQKLDEMASVMKQSNHFFSQIVASLSRANTRPTDQQV